MKTIFIMAPVNCPRCGRLVQGLLVSGRAGKFQGFNCSQCGSWSEGWAGEVDHPLLHPIFSLLSDILKGKREITPEGKKFIIDFFSHPEKYPSFSFDIECSEGNDSSISTEEFMAFLKYALENTLSYWQGKE